MSKKKELNNVSTENNTPVTTNKQRNKVDFAAEVARLRAMPAMVGVADRLEEAMSDEVAAKDQLRTVRKRLRKMHSGILTVLGENR